MSTGFMQSNTLFYLKDILSSTATVGSTFRISGDLELGGSIETGGLETFMVFKNGTQIERLLVTATGGVATIVKRGLQQDGSTANVLLQKSWNDGTICYITVKPDDFIATDKLNTAGGLRTNMGTAQNIGAINASTAITVADTSGWTNGASITGTGIPNGTTIVSFVPNTSAVLSANYTGITGTVSVIVGRMQVTEIDSSNNEVKKVIGTGSSVGASETIRKRKADGIYEEVAYSVIKADIISASSANMSGVAGEALLSKDFIYKEELQDFRIATSELASATSRYTILNIGDVTGNTRRSMKIVGNGVSSTVIKIGIKKTGTPVDNAVVRIETDDGTGKPSGTLANANATASIAGGSITTTMTDTTFTFAGAFTLTVGVQYHVVVQRSSGIDVANYYQITGYTTSARAFSTNLHNGTVWGTASITVMLSCVFVGTYKYLICKASASLATSCFFEGVVISTTALGASVLYSPPNLPSALFSGLTVDTAYYLSNTAGAISTTPGTIVVQVGTSDNTGNILFVGSSDFFSSYSMQVVWGGTFGTGANSIVLKVKRSSTFNISKSGGSGGVYETYAKNGVSVVNTTFSVVPGDIIFISFNYGTTGPTVTLSELIYSPKVQLL